MGCGHRRGQPNMRAHRRTAWDADDYNVATVELDRLLQDESEARHCADG